MRKNLKKMNTIKEKTEEFELLTVNRGISKPNFKLAKSDFSSNVSSSKISDSESSSSNVKSSKKNASNKKIPKSPVRKHESNREDISHGE